MVLCQKEQSPDSTHVRIRHKQLVSGSNPPLLSSPTVTLPINYAPFSTPQPRSSCVHLFIYLFIRVTFVGIKCRTRNHLSVALRRVENSGLPGSGLVRLSFLRDNSFADGGSYIIYLPIICWCSGRRLVTRVPNVARLFYHFFLAGLLRHLIVRLNGI